VQGNQDHNKTTLKGFEKSKDQFRKLMRDIKFGAAKDEINYEEIVKRAVNLGIFPEGHPSLNEWCLSMNTELSQLEATPY
jgi:hypothetical protein